MKIDVVRLREVIAEPHSYYGSRPIAIRKDHRFMPGARNLLSEQFEQDMTVLDLGCGSGMTLIENRARFAHGMGLDNDPAHLKLAEANRRDHDAGNIEFFNCDLGDAPGRFGRDYFDLVFSERGPLMPSSMSVQRALYVLKPGGSIFAEMIGELHHQEVLETFGTEPRRSRMAGVLEQARVAFERNGIDVRIAADILTKWYYPDVYEWLRFQCDIWAWSGRSLPDPDDEADLRSIQRFVERNTVPSGEIETTHHAIWVGGIKIDPPGWESVLMDGCDKSAGSS